MRDILRPMQSESQEDFCAGRFALSAMHVETIEMKKKSDGETRILPKPIRVALGYEIKRLRGREPMISFADRAKTDAGNLSRIERGQQAPSIHMLYEIARAANSKMHRLLLIAEGDFPDGKGTAPSSPAPDILGKAWAELSDDARDKLENYVVELLAIERSVSTFFRNTSARRQSFEEKYSALPHPTRKRRQDRGRTA